MGAEPTKKKYIYVSLSFEIKELCMNMTLTLKGEKKAIRIHDFGEYRGNMSVWA